MNRMKTSHRSTFWILSFGIHALVVVALVTVVIAGDVDDERSFIPLVSTIEPSGWVWLDPGSLPHQAPDSDTETTPDGIVGPDHSVPDIWDPSDFIIDDGTELDSSDLHTTQFIRSRAGFIDDEESTQVPHLNVSNDFRFASPIDGAVANWNSFQGV